MKLIEAAGIVIIIPLTSRVDHHGSQPVCDAPSTVYAERAVRQLPEGFVHLADVDATIQQEVRYAGEGNFVGRPIAGYESPVIILTAVAAKALSNVQTMLKARSQGKYTLRVYDGYSTLRAVADFVTWGQDLTDQKMKSQYYPRIEHKSALFKGYIAKKYAHSRGSTVDLTMVDDKGQLLDMGSPFDLLDALSHYENDQISEQAQENRRYLRELMVAHGLVPCDKESLYTPR